MPLSPQVNTITHKATIYEAPTAFVAQFGEKNKCYTVGDMHGNALKLLYIMIITGAAQFKPTDKSEFHKMVKLLSVDAQDIDPQDYYGIFKAIYGKTPKIVDKDNVEVLDLCLAQLEINPNAHLRLVGDELGDRGSCDIFTLKLLHKMIKAGAKLDILLSNHGLAFIEMYEAWCKNSNEKFHDKLGRDQSASAAAVQRWLDQGLITAKELQEMYEAVYHKALKVIAYDLNDQDEIIAWGTHAPMGELDIIEMGEGMLNYLQQDKYEHLRPNIFNMGLMKQDIQALNEARNKEPDAPHTVEKMPEFKRLIDNLNHILHYNVINNQVTELVGLGFEPIPTDKITNYKKKEVEKQNELVKTGKGDILNGNIKMTRRFPFHTAAWNRVEPQPTKGATAQKFNGHDKTKHKNHQALVLDNLVGHPQAPGETELPIMQTPSSHKPELGNKYKVPPHLNKGKGKGPATPKVQKIPAPQQPIQSPSSGSTPPAIPAPQQPIQSPSSGSTPPASTNPLAQTGNTAASLVIGRQAATTPVAALQTTLSAQVTGQRPGEMLVPACVITADKNLLSEVEAGLQATPVYATISNKKVDSVYVKGMPSDQDLIDKAVERTIVAALNSGMKEPLTLGSPTMREDVLAATYRYCIIKGITFKAPTNEEHKDLLAAIIISLGVDASVTQENDIIKSIPSINSSLAAAYRLPINRPADSAAAAAQVEAIIKHNTPGPAQASSAPGANII